MKGLDKRSGWKAQMYSPDERSGRKAWMKGSDERSGRKAWMKGKGQGAMLRNRDVVGNVLFFLRDIYRLTLFPDERRYLFDMALKKVLKKGQG
ncbi:hypothetical protein Tco_1428876 [Tanacetum coccineum]